MNNPQLRVFDTDFFISYRNSSQSSGSDTTFTKTSYNKAMVLPQPEVSDLEAFQKGVSREKNPQSVGVGARLVDLKKGNSVVLFESLQNDFFLKWEQVETPVYCDQGISRKTMECTLNVQY